MQLATALAAQPATAVRLTLEALRDADDKTLDELLAAGAPRAVLATMGSPDAYEGMMAFVEKRRPIFNRGPEPPDRSR